MFGFLKEKLKKAAQIFSKKIEDEGTEFKLVEVIEEIFSLEEPFKKSLGKNQSSELQVPIPPNAISVSGLTKDQNGNIILTIG